MATAFGLGDSRRAASFYGQALQIAHETGDQRGEADALANQSVENRKLGNTAAAIAQAEAALEILSALKTRMPRSCGVDSLNGKAIKAVKIESKLTAA